MGRRERQPEPIYEKVTIVTGYRMRCEVCGCKMTGRKNKRTCSGRCRAQLWRNRQKRLSG